MAEGDTEYFPPEQPKQIEKKKPEVWDSIRNVGPDKPLGYLPMPTVYFRGGPLMGFKLQNEAHQKGYTTMVLNMDLKNGKLGSLYVYSQKDLQALIDRHKELLEQKGWPTDAVGFVVRVSKDMAPLKTELYDLIADAYGDYDNPERLKAGVRPVTQLEKT